MRARALQRRGLESPPSQGPRDRGGEAGGATEGRPEIPAWTGAPGRGGGSGHPFESFIYLELLSEADTLFRD